MRLLVVDGRALLSCLLSTSAVGVRGAVFVGVLLSLVWLLVLAFLVPLSFAFPAGVGRGGWCRFRCPAVVRMAVRAGGCRLLGLVRVVSSLAVAVAVAGGACRIVTAGGCGCFPSSVGCCCGCRCGGWGCSSDVVWLVGCSGVVCLPACRVRSLWLLFACAAGVVWLLLLSGWSAVGGCPAVLVGCCPAVLHRIGVGLLLWLFPRLVFVTFAGFPFGLSVFLLLN